MNSIINFLQKAARYIPESTVLEPLQRKMGDLRRAFDPTSVTLIKNGKVQKFTKEEAKEIAMENVAREIAEAIRTQSREEPSSSPIGTLQDNGKNSIAQSITSNLLGLNRVAVIKDGRLVNISLKEAENIALDNEAQKLGRAAREYIKRNGLPNRSNKEA